MFDKREVAGILFVASIYAINRSLIAGIIIMAMACVALKANTIRTKLKELID